MVNQRSIERVSKKRAAEKEAKERLRLGYIHVPKTAGTSIARALKVYDSHHPIGLRKELEGPHSTLRWAATIRNPWDHTRSWFYYRELSRLKITFKEWVLMGCPSDWHYPPAKVRILYQEDWIEINGKCALDYIMKFENLDDEFFRFCEWLGIENPPQVLHYHLQRHKYQEIKARPYWEDYTEKMLEAVAPICEPFAERYGYKFGE